MMKRTHYAALLLGSITSTILPGSLRAQGLEPPKTPLAQPKPAGVEGSFGISIPSAEFRLPNGLKVVVHTDHTTPVVAVNVWYHVGSRNEPNGRTGFAHLFEHLMFQGSENYRDEYFRPFELVGATDRNGTTAQDRTNYYQTVPTPALDLALWMESDRMGHLLGAIDQKTLDEQRGVVQNEKRQRFGQPYGLVIDQLYGAIFPAGHPYHHTPIGSMADLDAASLDDVKGWFKSWYGPNNATLVLAGDIDLATAKEKVSKYFGDIPPSATIPQSAPLIPSRDRDTREIFPDKVPQAAIYRAWPTPGAEDPESTRLQMLALILGASGSSRLRERLVQKEEAAISATAGLQAMELASLFVIVARIQDGKSPAAVEKMIDQEIQRLIDQGPTEAEIEQARSVLVAQYIGGLVNVSGRAQVLNECTTYSGRPDCWKNELKVLSNASPEALQATARRWLAKGSHTIEVVKSDVPAAARPEAREPDAVRRPMAVPPPDQRFRADPVPGVDRKSGPPAVVDFPDFVLPPFQRAKLSNGMEVILAERHGAPILTLQMIFPSGATATDLASGASAGRAEIAMNMLSRGAGPYDAVQFASRGESLGAGLVPSASRDYASLDVTALKAKLPEILDLAATMLLHPRFDENELARLKRQAEAGIGASRADAARATTRITPRLLYGDQHPFGKVLVEADIGAISRGDLVAYMRDRLDPRTAFIAVAGDTTLAEVVPLLEARFGNWKGPVEATGPVLTEAPLPTKTRIFLIDQPGVPQSLIRVNQLVPARSNNMSSDALSVGSGALGNGFTSRLNMDLREDKHWSYGATAGFTSYLHQRTWQASASVQADRTADSMRAMLEQITRLDSGEAPVTATEIEKARAGLLALPGSFQENLIVAGAISSLRLQGWPDDYYAQYAKRIRAMTPEQATAAFASAIHPNALTWIVMGPLDKIEAPIRALGIGEVIVIDADGKPVKRN